MKPKTLADEAKETSPKISWQEVVAQCPELAGPFSHEATHQELTVKERWAVIARVVELKHNPVGKVAAAKAHRAAICEIYDNASNRQLGGLLGKLNITCKCTKARLRWPKHMVKHGWPDKPPISRAQASYLTDAEVRRINELTAVYEAPLGKDNEFIRNSKVNGWICTILGLAEHRCSAAEYTRHLYNGNRLKPMPKF